MKALILAAGRGSRMGKETDDKPKCLVTVGNRTLLSRLCDNFEANGLKDIAAVTGYLANKIQDPRLTRIFHNPAWDKTNMLASMLEARELFESDDVLVTYADIFYTPELLQNMISDSSIFDIAISYDVNFLNLWSKRFAHPLDDLETFRLDEHHFMQEIGNKPKTVEEIQGQYMGLLLFKQSSWPALYRTILSLDFKKLSMTELLNILIEQNFKIKAIPYSSPWGEVDTAEDRRIYATD
jgi:choline kinase